MVDAAVLARALRAGIQLRDKVVVLQIAPGAIADAQQREALAADIALGRALGMRLVAVCAPGAGAGPLDVPRPALRLAAALEKHGERGVPLAAAGMVTVHRLPPMPALPGVPPSPAILPVVNTILLIHLCSLGYVPILVLPVVDAAGEAVDVAEAGTGVVAAAVAQFMGAAMLVSMGDGAAPASPSPTEGASAAPPPAAGAPQPPGQPVTVTTSAAPGQVLADILLHAPPASALPPPASRPVSLGEMKGILSS